MLIIFSLLVLIFIFTFVYIQHPKFGKLPSGELLERIKKSQNYKNGEFQNTVETPILTDGFGYYEMFKKIITSKTKPEKRIPSIKTDLLSLDSEKNVLIWFGHSSYFIQIDKKKILVDPVFSKNASPVPFTIRAFDGTNIYSVDDMPDIDYLIITHDHWDHLDYKTVIKLKPKIKKIFCPLGVGGYFDYWDFDNDKIFESDWDETITLKDGFKIHTFPTRHFSGRMFKRNKTLWASFVLESTSGTIYISGDSGYGPHFSNIGSKFDKIDLAILDSGQYDKTWKHTHMFTNEVFEAGQDLRATKIFPVHNSKFPLAHHTWDEPLKKITELNKKNNISLLTPMIGEQVNLDDKSQRFSKWWEDENLR